MQIWNQHDQDTDNDLIFQTVSFWPQFTSIRKFFEIITMKESIKTDKKKLFVQFDLLQYRRYLHIGNYHKQTVDENQDFKIKAN